MEVHAGCQSRSLHCLRPVERQSPLSFLKDIRKREADRGWPSLCPYAMDGLHREDICSAFFSLLLTSQGKTEVVRSWLT